MPGKNDTGYIQPPNEAGYIEEEAGPGISIKEFNESEDGRKLVRYRKRITLVMLSGGIDSTYALAKILTESDDVVIAHHIHLINRENRHTEEARACENIVEYCRRKYRKFKYTQSVINRRKFKAFGMDVITAAFEAGIVVQSYYADSGTLIDRWTTGINAEDMEDFDPADTASHRALPMLKAFEANCHPHQPPRFFCLPLRPKRKLISYIGPKLTSLCWTCRTPVKDKAGNSIECGECHTCKTMQSIQD